MATIITIEGSIGSGKTTILEKIQALNHPDIVVLLEPVDEWMKLGEQETGTGLFELYYKDKQRYAFLFQMCALETRINNLMQCIKTNPGKIILTERCYMTDYEIFAKMLNEQGMISTIEFMVYKKWYALAANMAQLNIHGIVYLDVPAYECVTRIAKRDRRGEGGIDFNYLRTLAVAHAEWIGRTDLPILKLPADKVDPQVVVDWVSKMSEASHD